VKSCSAPFFDAVFPAFVFNNSCNSTPWFRYFYRMFYLVKTPWWLKKMYPSQVWDMPAKEKVLYLTFDDGPHEKITQLVLNHLKQYDAKATFFCIGKNVAANPGLYTAILEDGHTTGNHTHDHLNGWKTKDEDYIKSVQKAAEHIKSNLFRPPYGRITRFQSRLLQQKLPQPYAIIMWDVLSGDFDITLPPERCLQNVLMHSKPGSVIVFHDSTKAFDRMNYALPRALEYFSQKGYVFKNIPNLYSK
jgi:peptidoglycan/xylan/chitin deacetylase (PgdA/CDA1 family)